MMKAWHAGLLLLGLLVACGGTASRDRRDVEPPSPAGGAAGGSDDGEGLSGKGGVMSAGATAPAMGGGSSGSSASGSGGRSEQLGGSSGHGGAVTTLPLPPGCEPRARTETADSCSLAAYCDTASQLTNCRRLYSGRWQCQCETYHVDRVYQFEEADGLPACALAARLCLEDELKLEEESCQAIDDSSGTGGCKVELACGRPIQLGFPTDARAWLMRFGTASCQDGGEGESFACECSTEGQEASRYELLVDAGQPMCRPIVDWCMSGATLPTEGERECWLTDAAADSDGCTRSETCGVSVSLNKDLNLAQGEPRYAQCFPHEGGGTYCSCDARGLTFGFRVPDAPNSANCASAISACEEDAVIEPTSDVSCVTSSVDAYSDDSCGADLSCTQAATVDGRAIVAQGRLTLACGRAAADQPWWCSCVSDQQKARFQLGAQGASASEACGQAPTECMQRLPVHLGPHGEFVSPPDPLQPL